MQAILSSLYLLFISSLSSCSQAQQRKPIEFSNLVADSRTLIVYISRTNNTKAIAEMIQRNVGGDLLAIEVEKPYPTNYKETVAQVQRENESGYLPPIKTKITNIEKYDSVFVGFPTWGMALPPPMKSFLRQYNFNGKTIIPFNNNAGYGVGSSFKTIDSICKNSKVLEGFEIKGGVERDGILFVMKGDKKIQTEVKVKRWLRRIKVIE